MKALCTAAMLTVISAAGGARAQETLRTEPARYDEAGRADPARVEALERNREQSFAERRVGAAAVLIDGVASLVVGGILLVPNDEGARTAGGFNLAFGAIDTAIGIATYVAIGRAYGDWSAPSARAARRTPAGFARAIVQAAQGERREAVSLALNLGLEAGYAGIGGVALAASYLGIEHPAAWRGAGVTLIAQGLVLAAIDTVLLLRSQSRAGALVPIVFPMPDVRASVAPAAGLTGRF